MMSEVAEKIEKVLDEVKPVLRKARKPGFATSEFWTALAGLASSVAVTIFGLSTQSLWVSAIGAGICGVIAIIYGLSRKKLKDALLDWAKWAMDYMMSQKK